MGGRTFNPIESIGGSGRPIRAAHSEISRHPRGRPRTWSPWFSHMGDPDFLSCRQSKPRQPATEAHSLYSRLHFFAPLTLLLLTFNTNSATMASAVMSKAFVGQSLRAAVPTAGQVCLPLLLAPACDPLHHGPSPSS